MDAPLPGALGGTYAGNPLALASGLAVMDIIDSENLIERANTTGDKLRAALLDLAASTSAISEVRGLGAMIAVEFHTDRKSAGQGRSVSVRVGHGGSRTNKKKKK